MPPNRPEIIPELATAPAPAKLMPHPPADETAPLFVILQAVLAAPSMPSAAPVEVMVPVLVTIRGLSDSPRTRGPSIVLTIFLAMFRCPDRCGSALAR